MPGTTRALSPSRCWRRLAKLETTHPLSVMACHCPIAEAAQRRGRLTVSGLNVTHCMGTSTNSRESDTIKSPDEILNTLILDSARWLKVSRVCCTSIGAGGRGLVLHSPAPRIAQRLPGKVVPAAEHELGCRTGQGLHLRASGRAAAL